MNPLALMHIKPLLQGFQERHPKFIQFLGYSVQALGEDSLLEIKITSADGTKAKTNLKITKEDLELMDKLKELVK